MANVLSNENTSADEGTPGECVSQEELTALRTAMAIEMSAVRSEMERRVDQIHSQLHYWQNVTVNILKDHYSSLDTRGMQYLVEQLQRIPRLSITLHFQRCR